MRCLFLPQKCIQRVYSKKSDASPAGTSAQHEYTANICLTFHCKDSLFHNNIKNEMD